MFAIDSYPERLEPTRQQRGSRPKGLLFRCSDLGSSRSANPKGTTGTVPIPQSMPLGRTRKGVIKWAGTGVLQAYRAAPLYGCVLKADLGKGLPLPPSTITGLVGFKAFKD